MFDFVLLSAMYIVHGLIVIMGSEYLGYWERAGAFWLLLCL